MSPNLEQELEEEKIVGQNIPPETLEEDDDEVKIAIIIKDLHKSYGKKKVLKGLNLEVYPGELFGFIGKNGIGKSTTIDCVIGSTKFNSGTITLKQGEFRLLTTF